MNTYLAEIAKTIKTKEGCDSVHQGTSKVRLEFEGQTVWDGEVEAFELINHPKAKRCYAWGYKLENMITSGLKPDHIFIVLEIPPVDTPQKAVKVGIAAVAKRMFG